MSADTKAMIAVTALNNMFESHAFSICTIDQVATMLGGIPDKDAYRQLHALHCVHWSAMPAELRRQVPDLVQRALSGGARFRFQLVPEAELPSTHALTVIDGCKHTRRPLRQRLFGG
ncbi:MAG TPA: hypothetical protein VM619_14620 [Luteimonas sp.]|nr:hypothetical protein [Luteimonas sp.]